MDIAIILKVLAALMFTFIWSAYLRRINIFSRINWMLILFPLIIGGLSAEVVLLNDLPDISKYFDEKNIVLQKFIFYTYNVALLEEFFKFLGSFIVVITLIVVAKLLVILNIIKKNSLIEEPNIIIYAALVALGFASVENFIQFREHGVSLVYMRGMMSTVSHIIGTSIITGFMVVGYRKGIGRAILYTLLGLLISTAIHGFFDFFISQGTYFFLVLTFIIFTIEIEVWSRIMNNFLNFSRRINLKKSIDRNTLQKFLLISFMIAGTIQLFGLLYEEGWEKGIIEHLNLLTQELIITLILIIRITRFKIIPRYWKRIYPVLPITIRWGKFQRSIIPTSPRFFLKIRGDEFNEFPFTSLIGNEIKLRSLPQKEVDFETEVNVKMLEKKFIGPKKELYYLCEILDFHTIHPQYNSRFVLIRPKNYGKKYYIKTPIVGLIALKGFVNLDNINPKDCKFIHWMAMKKEGIKTPSQRMWDMIK